MLPTTRVEDWMSTPLITAAVGTTTETIARTMSERRIRHVPLIREDGRCLGVVCDADVFAAGTLVGDSIWMQRESHTPEELARPLSNVLHHTDELAYALAAMLNSTSDHAMVLAGTGRPVGIFTEHDAVRAGAQLLDAAIRLDEKPGLHAVQRTASAAEALNQMVDASVRHLLVLDGTALVGVISFRDVVSAEEALTAGEIVPAGPVHTMPMGSPLRWAAGEMAKFKIGCLVEVDGNTPINVVSRTDIVQALMRMYDADEDTGTYEIRGRDLRAD